LVIYAIYTKLSLIKLRKGKALRKHNLQVLYGKIAASVLLKLLMRGNERCHTTDALYRLSGTLFLNVNKIQFMIPEEKNNYSH